MQCQAERIQECFPFCLFKTLRAVDREFRLHLPGFDIHYVYMLKLFDRLGGFYVRGSARDVRQELLCLRVLLRWIDASGSRARLLCMYAPLVDDCVIRFWQDPVLRAEGVVLLQDLYILFPGVARKIASWHSTVCRHVTFDVSAATESYFEYQRRARSWESQRPARGVIPIDVLLCDYALRSKDLAWATGMVARTEFSYLCNAFWVCVCLWASPFITWRTIIYFLFVCVSQVLLLS